MYDHGVSYEEIARTVARKMSCIKRTINNDYPTPDNIDADYAFLSDEMKRKYPQKVSVLLVSIIIEFDAL